MAGTFGQTDSNSALVNKTADGVPLQQLWEEIETVVALYAAEVDTLVSLLTYRTVNPADAVPQSLTPQLMEEASEFGAPRAISPEAPYLKVGYQFKDYDLASRLGWRFIREASAEQIRAAITRMIEADRYTCQSVVLQRAFSPTELSNEWQHRVFGAYTGADGIKPPSFMGRTFDTAHTHYIATGSVDLDSEDLELLGSHVLEHGYGQGQGRGRLVALFNPEDVEDSGLTSWRAGVENGANGKKAKYDFIPSAEGVPPFLTSETVVGATPPDEIDGLPVLGSYGRSLICQSHAVPAGYFGIFATGGAGSEINPIAFREHPTESYRGLRFLPGNDARAYPIAETFSMRGFGVGTRRRGAFAVAQLTAGVYTAPTSFAL